MRLCSLKCALVVAVAALVGGVTGEARAQPPASYFLGVKYQGNGGDGLAVVGVVPGSPAEGCGLEVGDVLLSVNSRPIYDGASLTAALDSSGGFARLRIRDVRTGGVVFRDVRRGTPTWGAVRRQVAVRPSAACGLLAGSHEGIGGIAPAIRAGLPPPL